MITEDKFYTLQQVADLVQSHHMTVRRWIKTGKLPAYRVGQDGRFRIAGADLRAFLGARDAGVRLPK